MISYLPHERPTAGEILKFIGKINSDLHYNVTEEELNHELSFRIKHNLVT